MPENNAPPAAGPPAANDGDAAAPAPNPDDLNTEMTAEEEAAFVDRQLGITDSGAPFAVAPNEGTGDDQSGGTGTSDSAKKDKSAAPSDGGGAKKPEDTTSKAEKSDEGGDADNAGEGAAKGDKSDEDAAAGGDADQTASAPTPVDTTDLWVELEDANGKTFKIGVNDPVPDDLQFKNDAQLAEFTEARMEMKGTLRERQSEFEKAQADAQAKESSTKTEQQQLNAWDGEIQDLISAGLIEAPKAKPGDKDFLQDPSVQKIDAIFKYMAAENTKRAQEISAGTGNKPQITSFGTAYTLWANEQAKRAAEEAQNKSNQIAKDRGALVGSGSSTSAGGGSAALYEQGSAGSIHDLDFSDLE